MPLLVVLLNATLLHGYPRWVLLRGDPANEARDWLPPRPEEHAPPETVTDTRPALMPGPALASQAMSAWTTTHKMVERLVKTFTYLYGLLLLIGLWHWRRVFTQGDQLAIALFNVLLWIAIWIRYWHGLGIDYRYFYPSVITGMGFMALGLLRVGDWLARLTARRVVWSQRRRAALVTAMFPLALLAGTPDRSFRDREFMFQHADLGKWIVGQFGPQRRVIGCMPDMRLALYYAQTDPLPPFEQPSFYGERLLKVIARCRPDVVSLWDREPEQTAMGAWIAVLARHPELRYRRVVPDRLPGSCRSARELLVLVSDDLAAQSR